MKRKKHRLSTKWLIVLLFLVVGSSIALAVNAYLRNPYLIGKQVSLNLPNSANQSTPGIDSTSTSTSTSGYTFPVQAHHIPAKGAVTSPTAIPGKTVTGSPNYPVVNTGATLPPGSSLPSDSNCASQISTSSFEPRPDNNAANHQVPTAAQIANLHPWNPLIGMASSSDTLRRRITGNFTGTTDEILQWAACKWGIDVNIIRAEAVAESHWHQSQLGDYTTNQSLCPPGTWNGSSCYQSYGILQIKYTYFQSEWPMSRNDTAFNADFVYGWLRNCYEGWADYLYNATPVSGYPRYHAGDIWGCLGFWFSGTWYDQGAINYINETKGFYAQMPWLKSGF
jgi:hypothetical protein